MKILMNKQISRKIHLYYLRIQAPLKAYAVKTTLNEGKKLYLDRKK